MMQSRLTVAQTKPPSLGFLAAHLVVAWLIIAVALWFLTPDPTRFNHDIVMLTMPFVGGFIVAVFTRKAK
jgi:hypothetical protein